MLKELDRHDSFVGRWVVFHKGHLSMITKIYDKNKRPVLILIMNTNEHPYAHTRKFIIQEVLNDEKIPHLILIIPPISSVNWGRGVGYETNYVDIDENIKQISGTEIRAKIKNGDVSWKNCVPKSSLTYYEKLFGDNK